MRATTPACATPPHGWLDPLSPANIPTRVSSMDQSMVCALVERFAPMGGDCPGRSGIRLMMATTFSEKSPWRTKASHFRSHPGVCHSSPFVGRNHPSTLTPPMRRCDTCALYQSMCDIWLCILLAINSQHASSRIDRFAGRCVISGLYLARKSQHASSSHIDRFDSPVDVRYWVLFVLARKITTCIIAHRPFRFASRCVFLYLLVRKRQHASTHIDRFDSPNHQPCSEQKNGAMSHPLPNEGTFMREYSTIDQPI
jgi:hypothetical protein